ncbi:WD40-repeat-containing domain protein [Boeremia exigua]|uniref:WD40-repeat-containing domain protein n=1 Tax=Boeremia exigua TaxID=749465 RepID=UPI001E8E3D50|nr:WD40-repeat-containing domain protein [Boeremia exigua]KAH6620483.1 WD40-repeat-containing domain protein [Boeremia exigua]
MLPLASALVARYLRANGYTETLKTFIKEADLPSDAGIRPDSSVTIDSILDEKRKFDLSLSFEKLGVDDAGRKWAVPAPSKPTVLESLPSRSNILSVTVLHILLPSAPTARQYIAVTTADRRLYLLNPSSPSLELIRSYDSFQESPILDIITISSRYMLVAMMSGKLFLYDTASDNILAERKDHAKYIVKIATWSFGDFVLLATAGWDSKVCIYRINIGDGPPGIEEPLTTLTLPSIPETVLFVASPDDGSPILLVARRDSTFLYYYSVPSADHAQILLLGKQNLAPHSNAWVAFTPADAQICPTDPSVVAVATSSTPHMKLLIVKLLLPPTQPSRSEGATISETSNTAAITQASQARAELLIADREEAAIMVNVSTMAPQTAYSTPRLTWRPDGSGLYVSSDDGVVRGIEAKSGKLVASLEGHEPGSKLRCLWTGTLDTNSGGAVDSKHDSEVLISGGFDQRLILWNR